MANFTVIHTSPKEIKEIRPNGLFGDCLFFACNEYAVAAEVVAVYELQLDENSVIDGDCLEFGGKAEQSAIEDLVEFAGGLIDKHEAFDLLCDRLNVWGNDKFENTDTSTMTDISFEIQRLQGRIASEDGFDAFRTRDEQGTVFIVPMAGKLDRLQKVK